MSLVRASSASRLLTGFFTEHYEPPDRIFFPRTGEVCLEGVPFVLNLGSGVIIFSNANMLWTFSGRLERRS